MDKCLTTSIPHGILSADVTINLAFDGSAFAILTVRGPYSPLTKHRPYGEHFILTSIIT